MKKYLLAASLGASQIALAHPGHDHQHWAAEPIHILTAIAITAVIGTALYIARKQKAKNHD